MHKSFSLIFVENWHIWVFTSGKHFQLCFCLLPCSQLFWSLTGSTVNLKGAFPFSVFYILPLLASHFQLLSSFPSFWKILKLFSHVTGSFSLFFFFFDLTLVVACVCPGTVPTGIIHPQVLGALQTQGFLPRGSTQLGAPFLCPGFCFTEETPVTPLCPGLPARN